jgi:hypothetical protein
MPLNAKSPTIASQLTIACASEESNENCAREGGDSAPVLFTP